MLLTLFRIHFQQRGESQQGQNPLELLQGEEQGGRGAAQVPAVANGFTGQLGGQG